MKRYLLLPLALFLGFIQEVSAQQTVSAKELTKEYTLLYQDSDVVIHVRKDVCELAGANFNLDMAFLKVQNLTNESKSIQLGVSMIYNDECVNCESDSPEHLKSIEVAPNSTLEATCEEMTQGLSYTIRANHGYDKRIFEGIRLTTLNK